MQYKYYLHSMSFAQYMTTLVELRPIPPNQELQLNRPQLNQVMRPMMKYIDSNELWIRNPTTSQSYREFIKEFIHSARQLFVHRFSVPEATDRRIVRNSTVSIDIVTRVSADRGLKSMILAYIIVAITLLVYIEYNIYFRRYEN